MWYYQEKLINEIVDLPEGAFGLERKILQVAFNKKELTYLECKWQFVLEVLETNKYLNDNILGKFYDRDFR